MREAERVPLVLARPGRSPNPGPGQNAAQRPTRARYADLVKWSETEWQRWVMACAKAHGWRVVHYRAVAIGKGRYATPLQGDPGCPDLILARGGRVLLVELKTNTGKPTADQELWLAAAGDSGLVWRPRDMEQVEAILRAA